MKCSVVWCSVVWCGVTWCSVVQCGYLTSAWVWIVVPSCKVAVTMQMPEGAGRVVEVCMRSMDWCTSICPAKSKSFTSEISLLEVINSVLVVEEYACRVASALLSIGRVVEVVTPPSSLLP